MIGFNEITKKPTVKIDLSKAVSVEENHDPTKGDSSQRRSDDEELDEAYHVERSFRVTFKDGERIFFFADTDREVREWMSALKKIVGNAQIPQQCLWAQVALDMIKTSNEKNTLNKQLPSPTGVSPQSIKADGPLVPTRKSASTTSSSPTKRIPVPSQEDVADPMSPGKESTRATAPTPQMGQRQLSASRSRPMSMAAPQLSAVKEVHTPDGTPTKRPTSAINPTQQHLAQMRDRVNARDRGRTQMPMERPASVYVDGRP